MKKTLLIVFAVVSSLLVSSFAFAQSADNRTRRVKDQILTSTSLPAIRVKFDKAFKHVGSQEFILYDRAQVEQHFFVDADRQQRIKRMYMVQFEGYLPGISGSYNYPGTKTVSIAGQSYIADAEIVQNVPAAIKQDPQSDVARAASFLESKGHHIGEGIVFQRFVRLVDDAKRNEFILLYVEDLSGAGFNGAEKGKTGQRLLSRALKGFKILNNERHIIVRPKTTIRFSSLELDQSQFTRLGTLNMLTTSRSNLYSIPDRVEHLASSIEEALQ